MRGFCLHLILLCLYLAAGRVLFAQEEPSQVVPSQDDSVAEVNQQFAVIGLDKYFELLAVDKESGLKTLHLRFTRDKGRDPLYEEEFASEFGVTVFEKALLSYSGVSGLPINELSLDIPESQCKYYRIVKGRLHPIRPPGSAVCFETVSTAAEFNIVLFLHHKPRVRIDAKHLAKGANSKLSKVCPANIVRPTLQSYFDKVGARTSVLEDDEDGAELVVRELRNQVLHGSNYWEKLVIYVMLWQRAGSDKDNNPKVIRLRLLTEGSFAAGIGGYPPDSAFSHNMEPDFYKPLSEYTQQLGTYLRKALEASCR